MTTTWHEAEEGYDDGVRYYEFAETDDPRVVVVIERDNYARIDEQCDGDAINPIIYVEHRYGLHFSWVAGYDGGEAALMQEAYDRWGWDGKARKWLWKKHGIAADNASGGYDRDGNFIVATSRKFRDHVGATHPETYDEARESVQPTVTEVSNILDGYVYGLGFATNEARRLPDDEPIDLLDGDWDIDIRCWGYVGEDYAKRSALEFPDGEPDLPEMLAIEVTA